MKYPKERGSEKRQPAQMKKLQPRPGGRVLSSGDSKAVAAGNKPSIKSRTFHEIEAELKAAGHPEFRAKQLCEWLFEKSASSFDDMTNIPRALRDSLSAVYSVDSLTVRRKMDDKDGTRKLIFQLSDGLEIESVIIPDKERLTLCVSTQVGCAMGCRFCLTGAMGFKRNLETAEILDQLILAQRTLSNKMKIDNIVFMGMGEPLSNYDNFFRAVLTLTQPWGMSLSPRRITFSTCGLPEQMKWAAREFPPVGMAVSLNAPEDALRSAVMPVAKKHKISEVIAAAKEYAATAGGELTFEYVLLNGFNDSKKDAFELAALLKGMDCKVNLIVFNPFTGGSFTRPGPRVVADFQSLLMKRGIRAFVRSSRGRDIGAACGQLGKLPRDQRDYRKAKVENERKPGRPAQDKQAFDKPVIKKFTRDRSEHGRPEQDKPGLDKPGYKKSGRIRHENSVQEQVRPIRGKTDYKKTGRAKPEHSRPEKVKPVRDKPSYDKFGRRKPDRGGFEQDSPRNDKPGYKKFGREKPERGGTEQERPARGKPAFMKSGHDRPEREGYAKVKPASDKPGFKKSGREKPERGRPEHEKPVRGKPAFKKSGHDKPERGRPEQEKPVRGKPAFNKVGREKTERGGTEHGGFDSQRPDPKNPFAGRKKRKPVV